METQQHDGVVVEVAGIPTGLRQALREEGDVSREGEGGARAWGAARDGNGYPLPAYPVGKNIVSLVSCYHPPRRTVRDPLPEIRRF